MSLRRLVEDVQEELNLIHYHDMYEEHWLGMWVLSDGVVVKYVDCFGDTFKPNEVIFSGGLRMKLQSSTPTAKSTGSTEGTGCMLCYGTKRMVDEIGDSVPCPRCSNTSARKKE